jgi:hypothetical protein
MSTAGHPSTSGTCEPGRAASLQRLWSWANQKCSTTPSATPTPPRARRWPPSTTTCCGATVAGPGAATSTNCSRCRRSGRSWTHRGCHPGRPLVSGLAKTRTSTGYLPEQPSRTPSIRSSVESGLLAVPPGPLLAVPPGPRLRLLARRVHKCVHAACRYSCTRPPRRSRRWTRGGGCPGVRGI